MSFFFKKRGALKTPNGRTDKPYECNGTPPIRVQCNRTHSVGLRDYVFVVLIPR